MIYQSDFCFFRKDICLFLAGSRMELLLELHCVNNEGCFYILLLGLLREDLHHVNSLSYSVFFFLPVQLLLLLNLGLLMGKEV